MGSDRFDVDQEAIRLSLKLIKSLDGANAMQALTALVVALFRILGELPPSALSSQLSRSCVAYLEAASRARNTSATVCECRGCKEPD